MCDLFIFLEHIVHIFKVDARSIHGGPFFGVPFSERKKQYKLLFSDYCNPLEREFGDAP